MQIFFQLAYIRIGFDQIGTYLVQMYTHIAMSVSCFLISTEIKHPNVTKHNTRFLPRGSIASVLLWLYLETSVVVNTDHFSEAHVNTYK